MGIKVTNQAPIPPGKHEGVIIGAEESSRVFDPSKGPEEVVEVTIQPKWQSEDGAETIPVTIHFAPILNGISALSLFLKRLGVHPKGGEFWDPSALLGTEVAFTSITKNGFVKVPKDSIGPIKE